MSQHQPSNCFFYGQSTQQPSSFVFDQIYRNDSNKQKYATNPQYTYYNALLDMKHKLNEKRAPVYRNLFNNTQRSRLAVSQPHRRQIVPIYKVQQLNSMKYKVYKGGLPSQMMRQLPITQLNFQMKVRPQKESNSLMKPRLDQIISEFRKISQQKQRQNGSAWQFRKNASRDKQIQDFLNKTTVRFTRT